MVGLRTDRVNLMLWSSVTYHIGEVHHWLERPIRTLVQPLLQWEGGQHGLQLCPGHGRTIAEILSVSAVIGEPVGQ